MMFRPSIFHYALLPLVSIFAFATFQSVEGYKEVNSPTIIQGEPQEPSLTSLSALSVQRTPTSDTLNQQSSFLTSQEVQAVQDHIKSYWQLAYPNHSFVSQHLQVYNESLSEPTPLLRATEVNEVMYSQDARWYYQVDFRYLATVTLDTPASHHPLLLGMKNALAQMTEGEQALVSATIFDYEESLVQSQGNSIEITATYRLIYECDFDPQTSNQAMPQPSYYFQQRDSNAKNIMPNLSTYLTGDARYQQQVQEGFDAAYSFLGQVQALAQPSRAVTYNRQLATDYALAHALDVPEYNADNRLGSDCANFVSYCLQAAGITADVSGQWYPSATAGSYGGINWIRTGYSPNYGGVVLYMKNNNLFFHQANPILCLDGSILFYQDTSHVALVTHTDGEIVVFADRSNTTKEYNNFLFEGNFVDYYSPHPSIIQG